MRVVGLGLLALAACAPDARGTEPDADPKSVVDGSLPTTVTARVPVTGGTLATDGFTLTIPPGALLEATEVTISRIGDDPPGGFGAISALYRIEPADIALLAPVIGGVLQNQIILHPALWVGSGFTFVASVGTSRDAVVTAELSAFGDVFIGRSPARLHITPAELDVGEVIVGESQATIFSVTNLGGMTADTITTTFEGPDANDLAVGRSTCDDLAPDNVCLLTLTFTPSSLGRHEAVAVVSARNGARSEAVLTTTGIPGLDPWLAPRALAFGAVKVGTSSSALAVTLTNGGSTPIGDPHLGLIAGLGAPDFNAFGIELDTCTAPLGPDESCTVYVTARPTAVGSQQALLHVGTTPGGTGTVSLSVQGEP